MEDEDYSYQQEHIELQDGKKRQDIEKMKYRMYLHLVP